MLKTFFPYQKPRYGLAFGPQSVCLVEKQRSWFRKRPRSFSQNDHEYVLPSGMLHPTHKDLNISDVGGLTEKLRQIRHSAKSETTTLTLPDLCAQLDLFDLETFPQKTAEQEDFLKWRFQQDSAIPLGDQHVIFQKLFPDHSGHTRRNSRPPRQRVLAASIRKDILYQYEEVCDKAGLIPIKVGLSCIELFNYFEPFFRWGKECFFTCLGRENFVFFAFQSGTLAFLRMKPIVPTPEILAQELIGTLQIFDATYPHPISDEKISVSPLYVLTEHDVPWDDILSVSTNRVDTKTVFPTSNPFWGVEPIQLTLSKNSNMSSRNGKKNCSLITLSALAGLY